MSLGRLLAAGRSLIGLRSDGGRYREDKRVRLPRFVSAKNPFAPAAPGEPAVATPETLEPAIAKPREVTEAQVAPTPTRAARAARAGGWLGEWSAKWNPLARKPTAPGPARALPPQQGELSLDRVQVVRNDLRDSDLEMPRPTAAKPVSPVAALTAEKLEPVGAAWNRLTARFLGDDPG